MPPFLAINARITTVTESRPKIGQITKLQVLLREMSPLCWTTPISLRSTSSSPKKQLKITHHSHHFSSNRGNQHQKSLTSQQYCISNGNTSRAHRQTINTTTRLPKESSSHAKKKSGSSTCGEVITCWKSHCLQFTVRNKLYPQVSATAPDIGWTVLTTVAPEHGGEAKRSIPDLDVVKFTFPRGFDRIILLEV